MKKQTKKYFLDIAKTVSKRSKDPSTKVGAVLVDSNDRIISTGYNGFVAGCDESHMSFERPLKYHLTIHAEQNAILFARESLIGAKTFVTHGPCQDCLKLMLQAGIREIYIKDVGPIKDRGSQDQKLAISLLIKSTNAIVEDENGNKYTDMLETDNG